MLAFARGARRRGSSVSVWREDCFEDIFRHERNGGEPSAEGVFERIPDGVDDRRSRAIHRKFADSFCAICPVNIAHFFEEYPNRRQVRGGRHDVVCHLPILHASMLPDDFFIQGKSDALRDATGNLALRQNRMKNPADFLQGHEILDGCVVGRKVDRDFCNINRPGKRSIGFATIFLIIPENSVWSFVMREGAQLAVRGNMRPAG